MRIDNIKHIVQEEYPQELRESISKLAYVLNNFMEQTVGAINGGIDFENLNEEIKVVDLQVNSSGTPENTTSKIKTKLTSKIKGIIVIRVENLTNSSTYPTSTPLVSFTANEQLLTIDNITSLQANTKYRLTLRLVG